MIHDNIIHVARQRYRVRPTVWRMKTVECLLEDADWAIEDLAERAGLPVERTAAIAMGRWTPSPHERQRIASALAIPVSEISWGHTMDPRNVRYRRFGFRDPQ